MAFLISHRGNIEGINPSREDSLEYVKEALEKGYHCMVDVWLVGGRHVALGVESACYQTTIEFLQNERLICNARSPEALEFLLRNEVHCFAASSTFSLTNGGLIWVKPGGKITPRGVLTLPEWTMPDVGAIASLPCAGICSNQIAQVKRARDSLVDQHTTTKAEDEVH